MLIINHNPRTVKIIAGEMAERWPNLKNGLKKALELIDAGKVYQHGKVTSRSSDGIVYQTDFTGLPRKYTCDCPATVEDIILGKVCCHTLAQHLAHLAGADLPEAPVIELTPAPLTIWDLFIKEAQSNLFLWTRETKVIWKSGNHKVYLFCDRDRGLRLVSENGKVTCSEPLARNLNTRPVDDWRMEVNARNLYNDWAAKAKS